jgi:hypothetical protein
MLSTTKPIQKLHEEAVENFVKFRLTYMFTATLMPSGRTSATAATVEDHRIRFVFSKPTQTEPEPAVTVTLDAEVVSEEGTKTTYALFFENQMYKRLITVDAANVTGEEFNERLIDKTFAQKMAVRKTHLWEKKTNTTN